MADTENYYSDFSDIQFLNIAYFISFFDINNDVSYCKGWRPGENTYDGIKWNIKIKKMNGMSFGLIMNIMGQVKKLNIP